MTDSENAQRDPVELLLEEYVARVDRGEAEPIEEFIERSADAYPEQAARIRERLLAKLMRLAADLGSAWAETATDRPLLEPAQEIRHYRVERFLGRGGMSEIYLAQNRELGSDVVLKLLHSRFSKDEQLIAAFEREARMAAHLDHPNIATIHDRFEVDGRHYLVMEYVEGGTLGDLLKEEKPLPLGRVLDLGAQIAQGLAAAHRRNVIHRDLKPDNLMITSDGRVKILDFGLAKVDQSDAQASSRLGASVFPTGAVLGTVGYMSPEQASGFPVDARSDLFALGVVLYQMATGTPPFQRSEWSETRKAILTHHPPLVTTLNPEVPAGVARLIDRLLAKEPEDRYQSAEAVLDELESLRSPPESRRRPAPGPLAFLPLALVALLVAWLMWPDRTAPSPDPQVEELRESIREARSAVDLARCREHLEAQETRLGAAEAGLPELRLALEAKVHAALERARADLEGHLAAGDWDRAADRLDEIRALDDGPVLAQADGLIKKARKLRDSVGKRRDAVAEWLADPDRLEEAWTVIPGLEAQTFEGKPFKPAVEAAREMKRELLESLISELEELSDLEDPEDRQIARFRTCVALLGRVQPSHEDLERFDERREELAREQMLRRQQDDHKETIVAARKSPWDVTDSEGQRTVYALEMLHERMHAIDPAARLTKEVKALFEKWKLAGETYRGFESRSPGPGPAAFIGDDRLPVERALEWLKEYEQASAEGDRSPAEARAALEKLRETSEHLARRFRDKAVDLLGALEVEIAKRESDAETKQLISQVQDLADAIREGCLRRQLPTADQRRELARLKTKLKANRKLAHLEAFAGVDQAVEDLERQRAEEEERERRYREFRRALRHPGGHAGLQQELRDLDEGWLEEKRSLDKAIDHAPVPELLWRRALVNLRLRRFGNALDDVRASGRVGTEEGLLLAGMAEYGRNRLSEAAGYFDRARRTEGKEVRARAYYWLGTIANRPGNEAQALDYLEQALAIDDGLADAHYQTAVLRSMKGGRLPQVVESARRNLDSPAFSEDEMVALFAGVAPAEYVEEAKKIRSYALVVRAAAHGKLGQFQECIADCEASLSLTPKYGQAYYLRGYAKYSSAKVKGEELVEECLEDVARAVEYAANDSERLKARNLKKLIEPD